MDLSHVVRGRAAHHRLRGPESPGRGRLVHPRERDPSGADRRRRLWRRRAGGAVQRSPRSQGAGDGSQRLFPVTPEPLGRTCLSRCVGPAVRVRRRGTGQPGCSPGADCRSEPRTRSRWPAASHQGTARGHTQRAPHHAGPRCGARGSGAQQAVLRRTARLCQPAAGGERRRPRVAWFGGRPGSSAGSAGRQEQDQSRRDTARRSTPQLRSLGAAARSV